MSRCTNVSWQLLPQWWIRGDKGWIGCRFISGLWKQDYVFYPAVVQGPGVSCLVCCSPYSGGGNGVVGHGGWGVEGGWWVIEYSWGRHHTSISSETTVYMTYTCRECNPTWHIVCVYVFGFVVERRQYQDNTVCATSHEITQGRHKDDKSGRLSHLTDVCVMNAYQVSHIRSQPQRVTAIETRFLHLRWKSLIKGWLHKINRFGREGCCVHSLDGHI